MVWKVPGRVVIVLVVLLAICGAAFYLAAPESLEDMRLRADALPFPRDFVLVSESYRGPGFGTPPSLERVYHASWSGLCDSLQNIGNRAGDTLGLAKPRGYEGRICNFGVWYPAGWRGWCRNFRHYDLRVYAWDPELVQGSPPDFPSGLFVLYPRSDGAPGPILIPAGRAKVLVQLIAWRGR